MFLYGLCVVKLSSVCYSVLLCVVDSSSEIFLQLCCVKYGVLLCNYLSTVYCYHDCCMLM